MEVLWFQVAHLSLSFSCLMKEISKERFEDSFLLKVSHFLVLCLLVCVKDEMYTPVSPKPGSFTAQCLRYFILSMWNYRFCHDESVPLTSVQAELVSLSGANTIIMLILVNLHDCCAIKEMLNESRRYLKLLLVNFMYSLSLNQFTKAAVRTWC